VKLQLPSSVSSTQDLTALTLEVRDYARWFSHAVVKMHVAGSQVPRPPVLSPATTELLNELSATKTLNQKGLDELIAQLEDCKASAPTMTITLAAPAPGDLKQGLVTWCRQNIAPNMLINFTFSGSILGGMVVRFGSHVFDWSFRRQILANRQKFPEILRRV
jgi:hypothetical protein